MNDFGEMSAAGSVLSNSETRERRKKRGQCETCGTKCYEKHLFKTIPITVDDEVLDGRCLICRPLKAHDTASQDMSQENQSLRKSGRVSWRMGRKGKFFRANSDNSSMSGKSDSAMCPATESISTSSASVASTTVPTRITYPEHVIEEGNEEKDASRYSQAIAGAAALQLQRGRSQKQIGAKAGQDQDMVSSSYVSTNNSPRSASAHRTSSHTNKQSIKDFDQKDLKVKKSLRVRAKEQSTLLDERIDKKLRNMKVSATPKQPAIEKQTKAKVLNLNDDQILSELSELSEMEQKITYVNILDIAARYPSRLKVQQRAIHLLSKLDHTESDLSNILDSEYQEIIFDGMKKFARDKELQFNACRFLWKLSMASNKNKVAAAHACGIETVLNVMCNFKDDEQLQEIAVAILSNLCQVQEIQLSVFELGGIKIIVQAMAIHHKSISIQESSCTALSHLATYGYSVKTSINAEKGCEQISIAMVENLDLEFLYRAFRAIRAICTEHEENKISAVNCGITDSIVSAMQVHREEAKLQAAAASTIWCLGSSEVTAPMIGESGGIAVILRAMWLFSDHVDMQRSSCRSLYVLSKNTENQALIVDVNGIAAVISAMQRHVDDADIQEHSCGILANVAQLDDDTRAQIVADEALDAITITMVIHSDTIHVQEKGCLVLLNLVCTSTLDPLRASNAIELIHSAATKFPDKCGENAHKFSRMFTC